jgi:restriction system protein
MLSPTFQDCTLPTLRFLADQRPHARAEIVDAVANALGLSEEDRQRTVSSGRSNVIVTRVHWAIVYMKQAGLLKSEKRGVHQITPRGLEVLRANPPRIDVRFLEAFPDFREFQARSRASRGSEQSSSESVSSDREEATPEEALEQAHTQLRRTLESELLEAIKAASPSFFERLVVDLLLRMGYGGNRDEAGQVLGRTGDGGVDGIIKQDRLGLDVIYIQAKRWAGSVGRPEVQRFAGALQGHRARKGVFLTTGTFTREAEEYAAHIDSKIVLVDGARLTSLMYERGVGVSLRNQYEVKQIDSDYFEEEG